MCGVSGKEVERVMTVMAADNTRASYQAFWAPWPSLIPHARGLSSTSSATSNSTTVMVADNTTASYRRVFLLHNWALWRLFCKLLQPPRGLSSNFSPPLFLHHTQLAASYHRTYHLPFGASTLGTFQPAFLIYV